jgi:phosphoesterase RecJ-like protein
MHEVIKRVNDAKRIALVSHVYPDGDAVGSLVGLTLSLQGLNKEVYPVLFDGAPPIFHFLSEAASISRTFPNPANVDIAIILDANDLSRTNFPEPLRELSKRGDLLVIDHHPRGDLLRLCSAHLHKTEASSTAELVYELISELDVKITPSIATALLTGIYTDTGGFQYQNTTTWTLDVASELMRRGAKLKTIVHEISNHKSVASLKLLGLALERMVITNDGRCTISVLTHKDISNCGGNHEDIVGIIGQLNVLPSVQICMLLIELEPGIIQGSIRTGENFKTNVSHLAKILGGGGHPRASGFTVRGHIVQQSNGKWRIEK